MMKNMKEFAQYLTNVSFDEALHHARQVSYERVIANEQTFDIVRSSTPQLQQPPKVTVA